MTDDGEVIDPDNPEHHKKIDGIMADALANVFREKFDGTYVTKFVMLVEVMDKNGEQSMWQANTPGMGAWDQLGFLEFGKMVAHDLMVSGQQTGEDD